METDNQAAAIAAMELATDSETITSVDQLNNGAELKCFYVCYSEYAAARIYKSKKVYAVDERTVMNSMAAARTLVVHIIEAPKETV